MGNKDFLNNILKKIGAQIPCPKCRKVFADSNLSVVSFEGKNIQLETVCAHCDAKINIGANVKSVDKKEALQNKVHQQVLVQKHKKWLSPESVRNIASRVRNFEGNDIKKLFL